MTYLPVSFHCNFISSNSPIECFLRHSNTQSVDKQNRQKLQTEMRRMRRECEKCKVQSGECNFLSKCFRQKGHKTFAVAVVVAVVVAVDVAVANWQTA